MMIHRDKPGPVMWLLLLLLLPAWSVSTVVAQNPPEPFRTHTSPRTGHASFVTGVNRAPIPVSPNRPGAAVQPIDFFRRHGRLFGITDADNQLNPIRTRTDALGHTHTTFHQHHRGIPVFAGVLKVHQDPAGAFLAANGDAFSIPFKLSVTPEVTAKKAERIAEARLGRAVPLVEKSELVIVDPGWYGDAILGPHLAYHVVLSDPAAVVREAFFIDAHSGVVLDRWNMIHHARDRQIHDAAGGTSLPGSLARSEGEPPVGVPEVNLAYDYAGDTYDYFFRAFGRDSLDDQGMPLVVTVRSGALNCPNAIWNGQQAIFCSGLVTDDIIAHELTHGVTEFTANLIYQNQPGQLNESISDIFSELLDLYNGDASMAGTPGGTPAWPTHASGPGTDSPNNLRTGCSSSSNSFADGYRWLLGEDSALSVIRDMWDPTCKGHPDRANSPLQTCPSSDFGGVHSGSGVPNHACAIMTDGKSFNGQTVTGIGPIKTGAVWYRALTTYLTVASDFEDAYNALNQAAADLVGTDPNDPRTGLPSGDPFTEFDAEQVDKALLAVEMNTEGACGATVAILDSAPPDRCGPPNTTIFADDFEGGTNGWTVSNTQPPTPYDWERTTEPLPFDRPGTAWFVANADIGDCHNQDESAVHYLISPAIEIPTEVIHPTLAFTHYIASEPSYDGGNVHIRVNGGEWRLVSSLAFEYNAYNTTLRSASGSTNPLAGQEAWTGAGGEWGTSVIDLRRFVSGGESIQIRFAFGKDGCTGVTGWYVDDFEIYTCPPAAPKAINTAIGTGIETPTTLHLRADDEGLPDPPGMLTFTIASLPLHGVLRDPGAGIIAIAPYTLTPGANQVNYQPKPAYEGPDGFTFKVDDGGSPPRGGVSNEATASIIVGGPEYFTELFTGPDHPFDLDYHALLLTPSSNSTYVACLETITELPTSPAGGKPPTSLYENGSDLFRVAPGHTVSLFGQSYGSFWFSSNGFITFDSPDTNDLSASEESLAGHFANKRISALFNDLSPPSGGSWTWKELADRIAITWEDVPEFGTSNSNTFQVELYYDGRIQIAWLNIDTQDALVGLSNGGGVPPDFVEWDLSAYPICPVLHGDLDDDGDVDGDDFVLFEACVTGPTIPLAPACEDRDFDGDNDVDQTDYATLQRCYSGADVPADPDCE